MEKFEDLNDLKFQKLDLGQLAKIRAGEFTRYIEPCWIGSNMDYDSVEDWKEDHPF